MIQNPQMASIFVISSRLAMKKSNKKITFQINSIVCNFRNINTESWRQLTKCWTLLPAGC